jgi:AcrR family transcriptional regulator
MDLLAETGDEDAVSLRAVAQRVGVSVPSIYLHFADKQALLDAVCEQVFAALDVRLREAGAAADDPFDALRRQGNAYVHFAVENPEHYRIVMMTSHDGDPASADALIATGAFGYLVESVRACLETGVFEGDAVELALGLWAAAHGVASLLVAKPYFPWPDLDAFIDRTVCMAGIGWQRWPGSTRTTTCRCPTSWRRWTGCAAEPRSADGQVLGRLLRALVRLVRGLGRLARPRRVMRAAACGTDSRPPVSAAATSAPRAGRGRAGTDGAPRSWRPRRSRSQNRWCTPALPTAAAASASALTRGSRPVASSRPAATLFALAICTTFSGSGSPTARTSATCPAGLLRVSTPSRTNGAASRGRARRRVGLTGFLR